MRKFVLLTILSVFTLLSGVSCATKRSGVDKGGYKEIIISVKDQKLALVQGGETQKLYDISTSKYGLGDRLGSYRTPTGTMQIAKKIGNGARPGTVFKSRRPTGEVLPPNSPGRDPIVSRILWLRGLEPKNRNAYRRYIYIHGTPEEWSIGYQRSYGCIRMRSRDVISLYERVPEGALVRVQEGRLGKYKRLAGGGDNLNWKIGFAKRK